MHRVNFRHAKKIFVLLLITAAAVSLLFFSGTAAAGVKNGLQYACEMLIPSLFPFMVLSSFIIRSGASDTIGKISGVVCRRVFHLPKTAASAVLLSFIGGFPIGAKCIRLLYDEGKLSAREAEQMMLFCVCSGPAFLITGVGTLLLNNPQAGLILYLAQLVSGMIIGIAAGLLYKKNNSSDLNYGNETRHKMSAQVTIRPKLTDAFLMSCSDGAAGILQLTALVAIFALFTALCEPLGIHTAVRNVLMWFGAEYPTADNALYILTEVTTACGKIASGGCPLWLLAFAVGFGGLSVHFQLFSILGDIPIHKERFFSCRLINAFLSSVIVYTVCRFYRPTAAAFAVGNGLNAEWASVTFTGAAAMIIMSVIFVLSIRKWNRV